jgi:hypothetical protein
MRELWFVVGGILQALFSPDSTVPRFNILMSKNANATLRFRNAKYLIKSGFIICLLVFGLLFSAVIVPSYYSVNPTYGENSQSFFKGLNYVLIRCPGNTTGCSGGFLFCSNTYCPYYTTFPFTFSFSLGQAILFQLSVLSIVGSAASFESARRAWKNRPKLQPVPGPERPSLVWMFE